MRMLSRAQTLQLQIHSSGAPVATMQCMSVGAPGGMQHDTHLWAMAWVPSALSGRNRVNTPNSSRVAQCSSPGVQLLNSPMSARACR